MVKLYNEDHASFSNFLRMPQDMCDELLRRVGPRKTKTNTLYRELLEPAGLKLVLIYDPTPSCPWEQLCLNEVCLESPQQHHFSTLFFSSVLLKSVNFMSQSHWFFCRNSSMDFSSVRQHAVCLARFCF